MDRGGVQQLFRRSMGQLDAVPIRGTEGAQLPFFSPDGEWVGFFTSDALMKVSLAGGPPQTLCPQDSSQVIEPSPSLHRHCPSEQQVAPSKQVGLLPVPGSASGSQHASPHGPE